jgi:MFS transporter, AAHS family, 3-hydroxyphenylpropionic acid transporter
VVPLLLRYLPETLPATAVQRERQNIVTLLFGGGRAVPTILLGVLFFLALSILYLVLNWLPTLVVGKGLSKAVAPQASMVFNFASVAGALLLGRAVDRWGVRRTMPITFAALVVALLGLSASSGIVQILFWSGAAGFLLLGAVYALYGVAAGYFPSAMRGAGAGVIVAVGRAGSVVGPLVAGLMLSAGKTPEQVLVYLAPVAALTALVVLALTFFRNAD